MLSLLLTWVCLSPPVSAADESEELRIGVIFPFTGKEERQGELGRTGIELALFEFADFRPRVFWEDSRSDPKEAVAAFTKLQSVNKIHAALTMGSPSAMALLPLADRARLPLLAMVVVSSFSVPDDFGFRLMGTAEGFGRRVDDLLQKELGKKKIALLFVEDSYGSTYAKFFDHDLDESVLVVRESYLPGTTDFRSQLVRLKGAKPDAVILASWGAEIGPILRQAQDLGLAPGVFICSGACDNPDVAVAAAGAADSLVVVASASRTTPEREQVLGARFHLQPTSVVLRFYDAVALLRHADKECAADLPERSVCLKTALQKSRDVPGSSYPINFDYNGDIIDAYELKIVRGGKLVSAKMDQGRVVPR